MKANPPAAAASPVGSDLARDAAERSRITFRQDRIRGACAGALETGVLTFGLVVIIRYFEAPQTIKAMVSSANAFGLLLTPVTLFFFARHGWTASRAASRNFAGGAAFLALAALAPNLWVYVPAMMLGSMLLAQQAPLLVHLYTANYAAGRRGRMLSNSIALSLVTSVAFSLGGGRLLDWDLESYRGLFAFMSLSAVVASWAVFSIPAQPFSPERTSNPLSSLRFAVQDRTFGWMLFVWMLMGLGNLMMVPLRVEYMANPRFGINLTNAQIAMVGAVIPSIVRLATTHLWGIFFDRYNFFVIRTMLNGFSLAGILLFFSTRQFWMLCLAAGMFGMACRCPRRCWPAA